MSPWRAGTATTGIGGAALLTAAFDATSPECVVTRYAPYARTSTPTSHSHDRRRTGAAARVVSIRDRIVPRPRSQVESGPALTLGGARATHAGEEDHPMAVLRTPEARFANLPGYPFAPHYVDLAKAVGRSGEA